MAILNRALTIDGIAEPARIDLLRARAMALIGAGRYTDALDDISRTIEMSSPQLRSYPEILGIRALAHDFLNHDKLAIADYTSAMELLSVEDHNFHLNLLTRAGAKRRAGLHLEAILDYQTVITLSQDSRIKIRAAMSIEEIEQGMQSKQ